MAEPNSAKVDLRPDDQRAALIGKAELRAAQNLCVRIIEPDNRGDVFIADFPVAPGAADVRAEIVASPERVSDIRLILVPGGGTAVYIRGVGGCACRNQGRCRRGGEFL